MVTWSADCRSIYVTPLSQDRIKKSVSTKLWPICKEVSRIYDLAASEVKDAVSGVVVVRDEQPFFLLSALNNYQRKLPDWTALTELGLHYKIKIILLCLCGRRKKRPLLPYLEKALTLYTIILLPHILPLLICQTGFFSADQLLRPGSYNVRSDRVELDIRSIIEISED